MKTEPRRQQILNLLEEAGTLNVNELADRFQVSLVTIRNDLDDLAKEGLLQRTFGGAVFSHRTRFNKSFRERIQQQRDENARGRQRRFRLHQRRRHHHLGRRH